MAEREHVTVLHYHGDYDLITEVTGQPAQWVVPPGTTRGSSYRIVTFSPSVCSGSRVTADSAEPRTPESTTPTSFRQWCQEVLERSVMD